MNWFWWPVLTLTVFVCFMAGIMPNDQGLTLTRCWLKLKYSISIWESALAILGVILAVIFHILTGAFKLMTFVHGALMILSEGAAEMIGLALPTYPKETKELEK